MLQTSVDASRCAVASLSCCSTSSDSLHARQKQDGRCGPIITLLRRRQKRRSDSVVGNSSGVGQDRFDVALTGREEETDNNNNNNNNNNTKKKKRTVSLDLGGNQKQTTVIEYSGELVAVEIERPLGLVLEESRLKRSVETQIEVVEIVPDSNAAKDGRVKVGDILRLTTAVFNVSAPIDVTTWLNPPAKANVRAFVKDATFDKTMLAIQSHSVPVDYDGASREMKSVGMVFERKP